MYKYKIQKLNCSFKKIKKSGKIKKNLEVNASELVKFILKTNKKKPKLNFLRACFSFFSLTTGGEHWLPVIRS